MICPKCAETMVCYGHAPPTAKYGKRRYWQCTCGHAAISEEILLEMVVQRRGRTPEKTLPGS